MKGAKSRSGRGGRSGQLNLILAVLAWPLLDAPGRG